MISFHQFINIKEALSLTDPLAQSTLKIKEKNPRKIIFEFKLDNDNYEIYITKEIEPIVLNHKELDILYLMKINLIVNNSFQLTNKMGMQANIVYNMLLNSIKQANDHFGENNIYGYTFAGAQSQQDIMYDKLMKRFAPNLITWSHLTGTYLKPETIQKLKDQNPDLIELINNQIHQETSQREMLIQQNKQNKSQQRSRRRQQL
jgi:DNA polymerase III delta prime subunit